MHDSFVSAKNPKAISSKLSAAQAIRSGSASGEGEQSSGIFDCQETDALVPNLFWD